MDYGALMAVPRPPFFVRFAADRLPTVVDHSSSHPGPPGGSVNRAGFTRVRSRARLELVHETLPPNSAGEVGLYFRSVNVNFLLTDFMVAISSDFRVRSCAYRVMHTHEIDAHIRDPIAIFYSFRDVLIERLNVVPVPTQDRPERWLAPLVEPAVEALGRRLERIVGDTKRELAAALRAARDRHDSAASYNLVHNQCSDAEWASGR